MAFGDLLKSIFGGTPQQTEQLPTVAPDQLEALQQLLQQGLQDFSFDPIEQRARSQFQQQTIPSLAERFTSLGGGAQASSAFPQALGRAGAGLEEGLAGQRAQFGATKVGLGLQPQFENLVSPRQPGFGEQALSGGLQGLAQFLPMLLGGRGF